MRRSDEWMEVPEYSVGFLERSGGLAVDLPGFGRSGKPGYLTTRSRSTSGFIERFLDLVQVERVSLVCTIGVSSASRSRKRHPERVERLALINTVALLPGYRWHRIARVWRTPLLGELVMGSTNRWTLRQTLARVRNADAQGRCPRPGSTRCSTTSTRAPARDPAPVSLLAARGARGRRRRARRAVDARAGGVGIKPTATSPPALVAPTPRRSAVRPPGRADRASRRRPLPWLDRPDVIDRVVDFLAAT